MFDNGAAEACFDVAGKDGLIEAAKWGSCYQGGNMWAAWDSYLTAARDILGLDLPQHVSYAFWEQAAIHGGFRVMHPDFCIVCDFPEILKVDDRNLPHCENGPSHRWRDGWSLYHWHGIRIPDAWIEDKTALTPAIALSWPNVEQRRAAIEIVGWARVLDELNAVTIDEDADPEIGSIVEVEIPEIGKERFLRVRCATGRMFALPMPPYIKTAIEGQAWSFGYDDPKDWLPPEVRT